MPDIDLGSLVSRVKVDTSGLRRAESAIKDGLSRVRAVFTQGGAGAGAGFEKSLGDSGARASRSFTAKTRQQLTKGGRDAGAAAGKETGARFSTSLGDALQGIGAFAVARRVFDFFGGAKDAAVDFESAFTGVRKTVDGSEATFAKLETGIRQLAQEIPSSASEIARVAENAGQLGISANNLLSFSRAAIALGETTNLSAEEASTALAQLANVTGLPQSEIERLGSALVDLGNKGTSTEKDILELSLRFAGAGKIAGLAQDQILGIAAAFANVGVESEAGGTAIQKVLLSMLSAVNKGGEDLEKFADVAGVSAEQFAASFRQDAAGAFTQFVEGLSESGTRAGQVLEGLDLADQRLVSAFLRVAGAAGGVRTALDQSGKAFEENTALTEEYGRRLDTDAAKLQTLSNRFTETKIRIGGLISTGLVPLLEIAARIPSPLIAAATALAGLAAAGVGIVKVRKIIADTADELRSLGRAGRIAVSGFEVLGKAGLIATVVTAIGEAVDFAGDKLAEFRGKAKPINEVQNELLDLAKGTGDINRLLRDAGILGLSGTKNFEEVARKLDSSEGAISRASGRLLSLLPGFGKVRPAEIFEDLDQALVKLVEGGAVDQAATAVKQLAEQLDLDPGQTARLFDDYRRAVSEAGTQSRVTSEGTSELTKRLEDAGVEVDKTTGSMDAATKAFQETEKAIDDFNDAIKQTTGILTGSVDATIAYEAALDDLAASIKNNGKVFDLNTEKGRANASAVTDLIDAVQELTEAQVKQTPAVEDANQIQELFIKNLNDARARVVPGARAELDKYIRSLGGIPGASGSAAAKLEDLDNRLKDIGVKSKIRIAIQNAYRDDPKMPIKELDALLRDLGVRKNLRTKIEAAVTASVKARITSISLAAQIRQTAFEVKVRHLHDGGLVMHGGGPVGSAARSVRGLAADEVGIIARRGEFMVQTQAVDAIGVPMLKLLNNIRSRAEAERLFSLQLPRFHSGGLVASAQQAAATVIGGADQRSFVNTYEAKIYAPGAGAEEIRRIVRQELQHAGRRAADLIRMGSRG